MSAQQIIENYCLRWYLEVTLEETKGKLGFEVWYLPTGKNLKTSRLPQFPWYRNEVPAFSDMLAALRRETWGRRLLDPAGFDRSEQKSVGPLLDAIGYAA